MGIFDPALGGDPVLFQHMFWFYSHPAVYIMILPAMGVISEIVQAFSRKNIFGYSFVAFSSLAIAIIGFFVWGHHIFVAGQSVYAGMLFSFLSFVVAVPSAIKVFNWTATIYRGSVSLDSPMLYAFGFLGLFTIGGLTGLFLAAMGLDIHVHDTYFVVAHFHYIMVGGAIMGYLGGMHYWWPKITGKLYSEPAAKFAALLVFVGFNLTFFPQFLVGYLGMPRRYHVYPPEFQIFNVLSTAGATVLAVGYLLPMVYFTYSILRGKPAPAESVGRQGSRVGNPVAATNRELRGDADRHARHAPVRAEQGGWSCLKVTRRRPLSACRAGWPSRATGIHTTAIHTATIRSCSTISTTWSSRPRHPPSACGCSWSRKSCSSAACSWPTRSIVRASRWASRKRAPTSTSGSAPSTRLS